jgi:pantothenate kinase
VRAGLPTHAIAGPQQCSSRAAVTGDLHFFVFETKQIEDVLTFFARYWPEACKRAGVQAPLIRATGGGSYKHAELFKRAGLVLKVGEEMECIVLGLNFLMSRASWW